MKLVTLEKEEEWLVAEAAGGFLKTTPSFFNNGAEISTSAITADLKDCFSSGPWKLGGSI